MTRKRLLFFSVCWLWLSLSVSAQALKLDLAFQHWGRWYFPWADWHWFKAQGIAESNLNQAARGTRGEIGIMQLMPALAQELGVNAHDPEGNIQGGIRYDRQIWDTWPSVSDSHERLRFAFAGYNAGPGNVQKAQKASGARSWKELALALPKITGSNAQTTVRYVEGIARKYAELR